MSPTFEALLKDLPPELQKEVEDYARYLLTKNPKRSRSKPTFGWAGALADLGKKYTSVELQHQARQWRQARRLNDSSD